MIRQLLRPTDRKLTRSTRDIHASHLWQVTTTTTTAPTLRCASTARVPENKTEPRLDPCRVPCSPHTPSASSLLFSHPAAILREHDMERQLAPILCADVVETEGSFELQADLPGVDKKDLEVAIDSGYITIKGVRRELSNQDTIWGGHCAERSHGTYQRTLLLPTDADTSQADCSFKDGVLKVSFPKLRGNASKRIKLSIK